MFLWFFVHFLEGAAAQQQENAVVPTEELELGSNFGAGTSRLAVFPARELRAGVEIEGPASPGAAGRPEITPPGLRDPLEPTPGKGSLGLYGEVRRGNPRGIEEADGAWESPRQNHTRRYPLQGGGRRIQLLGGALGEYFLTQSLVLLWKG